MTRKALSPILLGMLFLFIPALGKGIAASSSECALSESKWRPARVERQSPAAAKEQTGKKRLILSDGSEQWARIASSQRQLQLYRTDDPQARIPAPRVAIRIERRHAGNFICKPPVTLNGSPRSPPFQA